MDGAKLILWVQGKWISELRDHMASVFEESGGRPACLAQGRRALV